MVDFGVVLLGAAIEEGGEGSWGEGCGDGAVGSAEGDGEDAEHGAGIGAVAGDAVALGGEEAGGAVALAADMSGDLIEEAGEGGEVDIALGDEGRRWEGAPDSTAATQSAR